MINIAGLGSLNGTTQTLISAPGGGLTGTFTLGALTGNLNGYSLALVDTATSLTWTETLAPTGNAFWTGTAGTTWASGAGANFVTTYGGATTLAGVPGGSVTNAFFSTSGSPTNLSNSLGQSINVNSLSFTGSSGAVTLNNTGGYSLTLAAANSFTDQNSHTYAAGTGLAVQSGAAAHTIAAPIVLGSSQTWEIDNAAANALTVSGTIGDSGLGYGLTKTGVGTLVLSGSNTYTGGTTLAGGILNVGSAGALNSTGDIVFTGGTLQFSSANSTDYSSRIVNSSAAITIDTNSQNITYSGGIAPSNSGGLTKLGAGTLTLNGTNSYSGTTIINGGTLAVNSNAALGSNGSSTVDLNNGSTLATTAVITFAHNVVLGSGGGVVQGFGDTVLSGTWTGGTGVTFTSGDIIPTGGTSNVGTINVNNSFGTSTRLLTDAGFIANNAPINVSAVNVLDFNSISATLTNSINLASGSALEQRNSNVTLSTATLSLPTAGGIQFGDDDSSAGT